MQETGQHRLAQYLKQVECAKLAANTSNTNTSHCTAKSASRQEANAKCKPSAMQVNTLGIHIISPCFDALAALGIHYSEQSANSRRGRPRNQQTGTGERACGYCQQAGHSIITCRLVCLALPQRVGDRFALSLQNRAARMRLQRGQYVYIEAQRSLGMHV